MLKFFKKIIDLITINKDASKSACCAILVAKQYIIFTT